MGSGKSTIGPILANTLGYAFVDIDKAIEGQTGKTVKEIFKDHGEEHFRRLERTLIQDLRAKDHIVIPTDERRLGITVDEIVKRLTSFIE